MPRKNKETFDLLEITAKINETFDLMINETFDLLIVLSIS